ncbi:MAG: gamma-glutamyltransferase [Phycisphaerae bacterium]|nr:gamma-glutamyltransferase [Phycisphaerae bacterium]
MLPFSSSLPYPSRRQPLLARNCVATSQPLAAQAGLEIMRKGGNAADAAVATAAALTVVEPTSNGIGSDSFALVWAGGGLHGLNASGRAPMGMTLDQYSGMDSVPYRGWHGITTPGCVSGWAALAEDHGTMSLADLLEPAARLAEDGFPVSPVVSYYWKRAAEIYPEDGVFAEWHRVFAPEGRGPEIGEIVRLPDHAKTLREIGASSGRSFYEGRLADAMEKAAREQGGALRKQDLASHQYDWVRPIENDYHGLTLHEIPPNGQGLVALIALGILRHLDLQRTEVDSPECFHLQIEAMKLAFRDGHRYIADPAHMDVDVAALLDDDYLASRARLIDREKATDFEHGSPKPGGTILLTTADDDGNMVSYIQSNYTGFGSGVVVPGTGISLQNRGCCFSLEKGHPNVLAPGKRPYHTIIPGFVTRNGEAGDVPLMSFGVMGGFMQPQGHAQVVARMADFDQNPQAALDAPRWQVHDGMELSMEPGYDDAVYQRLRDMGHDLRMDEAFSSSFGRGQCIYKLENDAYLAASDPRADGQAVGF